MLKILAGYFRDYATTQDIIKYRNWLLLNILSIKNVNYNQNEIN
ncbi:hypothetical protein [Spiroplasma corruscae]|nr:hypothetical protein [Spiroplasma corruscae]